MSPTLPEPTPRLPGVITVREFAELVGAFVPSEEIRVVVDLGAMDGGDTLALKRAFPLARTVAIEGLRSNFDRYLSWLEGVEAHCAVIAARDGDVSFYEKEVNGVHGLFERETADTVRVHSVAAESLESFCRRTGIEGIDVLKVDVEGATLEALEGLGPLMETLKALHVESEDVPFFSGQRLDPEVTAFLSESGFDMVRREGRQAVTGSIAGRQFDSVWIHRRYLIR